jgi:hypothetical protein
MDAQRGQIAARPLLGHAHEGFLFGAGSCDGGADDISPEIHLAGRRLSGLMNSRRIALAAILAFVFPLASRASCMNKFLRRSDGSKHTITLLTGKLTYQEAYALAKAIQDGKAPMPEWVDEKGKTIAKAFGDFKIVRPMPVGCDGKASGVVLVTQFLSLQAPAKKMSIKLDRETTVEFEQQ